MYYNEWSYGMSGGPPSPTGCIRSNAGVQEAFVVRMQLDPGHRKLMNRKPTMVSALPK